MNASTPTTAPTADLPTNATPAPTARPATSTQEKDKDGYPTRSADNLRRAFAVVGALIGQGLIDVDLEETNEPGWFNELDFWVTTVARTLDMLQE